MKKHTTTLIILLFAAASVKSSIHAGHQWGNEKKYLPWNYDKRGDKIQIIHYKSMMYSLKEI